MLINKIIVLNIKLLNLWFLFFLDDRSSAESASLCVIVMFQGEFLFYSYHFPVLKTTVFYQPRFNHLIEYRKLNTSLLLAPITQSHLCSQRKYIYAIYIYNSFTFLPYITSKFDWTPDDIRIEKIILALLWAC